eukprot:jgi/Botrbrau1/9678/Bobra.0201s0012.1
MSLDLLRSGAEPRICEWQCCKPVLSMVLLHSFSQEMGGDAQGVISLRWLSWLPLATGVAGIGGVLINRLASGIAPVADASSAQSRADVLAIGMAGVLLLTGLQWLSLRPRPLVKVDAAGREIYFLRQDLPEAVSNEINWVWAALQSATRTDGLIIFWKKACLCHIGTSKAADYVLGQATAGPICEKAMATGMGNYLPNLVLYPGRFEFLRYFPDTTQGILVQPIGEDGVLVLATQTQRGFGQVDQAWAAILAQKIDTSLDAWTPAGKGFGP